MMKKTYSTPLVRLFDIDPFTNIMAASGEQPGSEGSDPDDSGGAAKEGCFNLDAFNLSNADGE